MIFEWKKLPAGQLYTTITSVARIEPHYPSIVKYSTVVYESSY